MITIGVFEAKTHFSKWLEMARRGEEIIITRNGRACARLTPLAHHSPMEAAATLRELQNHTTLGDIDWKSLRDEGRQ